MNVREQKKRIPIKHHLPYVLFMIMNLWLLPAVIQDTGSAMVMMLVGMPLITLIIAGIHGWKAGAVITFAIITGILFLPAIFLYFNESAWVYSPAYALIALIGGGFGKMLASNRENKE